MAAMSRGSTTTRPVRHVKGGTSHNRNHRFEGFQSRVAKLKIEPIRKGNRTIIDDSELQPDFSFFKNALDEWKDLNMYVSLPL